MRWHKHKFIKYQRIILLLQIGKKNSQRVLNGAKKLKFICPIDVHHKFTDLCLALGNIRLVEPGKSHDIVKNRQASLMLASKLFVRRGCGETLFFLFNRLFEGGDYF